MPGRTQCSAALISVLVLAGTIGCGESGLLPEDDARSGIPADAVLAVEVVNYPLAYLAGRIGGERVEVSFRAPAGIDPAFWSPDAGAIAALQEADLILLNGAGYAGWVDRVSLPLSRLVDTSAGFRDRYITLAGAVTHSHGPEGEHSHGAIAFTTWLDPTQAIEQAAAVRDAFKAARPSHASGFDNRFSALESDLQALDRSLAEAFGGMSDAPLLASHPVYRYLARRYDLDMESVHFEPDESPDENGWRQLQGILTSHPARWMLWEGEPLASTRDRLAALGIGVILFAPCSNTPATGDYLTVMQDNVRRVEVAWRRPGS